MHLIELIYKLYKNPDLEDKINKGELAITRQGDEKSMDPTLRIYRTYNPLKSCTNRVNQLRDSENYEWELVSTENDCYAVIQIEGMIFTPRVKFKDKQDITDWVSKNYNSPFKIIKMMKESPFHD